MHSFRINLGLFLVYALLACSLLAPIASNETIPASLDLWTHTNLIVQADLALKEGQFPIRIAPTEHESLRYPEFQFYSPLFYTIAGYIYAKISPDNPYLALKIIIWLGMIIGAIYIYRITKQITENSTASALAGICYMAAPYLLINLFARGDITEAIGQCIIPVLLYYNFQIYSKKISIRNFCITSLMWSVLAMIHIVTFVNASISILIFFLLFKTENHFRRFLIVGLAYGYGYLLSAWYLGPIISYHSLLNISDTLTDPTYYNYFTLLPRLLSSVSTAVFSISSYNRVGYDTILSPPFYPSLGLITLLSVGLCIYYTWIKPTKFNSINKNLINSLLTMFFLTLFITWSPAHFWKHVPKILVVEQFSYRFLAQVVWIGTLLVGIAIYIFAKKKESMKIFMLGLIIICLTSSTWLMADYEHAIPVKNIVSGSLRNYVNAYLLKPSSLLGNLRKYETIVMDHMAMSSHCHKNGSKLICKLSSTQSGLYEFPVIYYPNLLNIIVDGKKASYIPIKFHKYYLTGINLTSGEHNIIIKFLGLGWANFISLVAWFLLGLISIMYMVTNFRKVFFIKKITIDLKTKERDVY